MRKPVHSVIAHSDWRWAESLLLQGAGSLPATSVYRGAAALANNGVRRAEEALLPAQARGLLEARRSLKAGRNDEALALMRGDSLSRLAGDWRFLEGDRYSLMALASQRLGQVGAARVLMGQAVGAFDRAGDPYRKIRSGINLEALSLAPLTSRRTREWEAQADALGVLELSANLAKSRCVQAMNEGKFEQALAHAEEARARYLLDGCPEDGSISEILRAIALANLGRKTEASRAYADARIRDGKAASYGRILETLLSGRLPRVSEEHPLYGSPWKLANIRASSPRARVLSALESGPRTRDELIRIGWDVQADAEGALNRLNVALSQLRKELKPADRGIRLENGEYSLV